MAAGRAAAAVKSWLEKVRARPSLRPPLIRGFARKHRSALLVGLALLLIGFARPAASKDTPLVFGAFPNLTAMQIVQTYGPLAKAIEKHLSRRVLIYSARDFSTFVARTHAGEYDLVLTAPHLAWLAQQEAGYQPLLKYVQPVRGLLVVKSDSPIHEIEALRGRTLATADPLAVVVLALQAELAANGLRRDIDYRTMDAVTHSNAAMQVVSGHADAAMLGLHPYNLMPAELSRQLRVLAETPSLSSLMYLTHPRLDDAEVQAIRKALLAFANTAEGRAFMQRGAYGGFTKVDGKELRAFRPYALQAQDMLQSTP